jgi:hypothetical protein
MPIWHSTTLALVAYSTCECESTWSPLMLLQSRAMVTESSIVHCPKQQPVSRRGGGSSSSSKTCPYPRGHRHLRHTPGTVASSAGVCGKTKQHTMFSLLIALLQHIALYRCYGRALALRCGNCLGRARRASRRMAWARSADALDRLSGATIRPQTTMMSRGLRKSTHSHTRRYPTNTSTGQAV